MKTIKFLILITFITSISFSQTGEDKVILSGNLFADSKIILNNYYPTSYSSVNVLSRK